MIRNSEIRLKVQKRISDIIRICLIGIGSLIILGGIIGYYIEKANCPPESQFGCGSLSSAGIYIMKAEYELMFIFSGKILL